MAITIKDIAKRANVSIATVSRVLNNKEEGIGEATRKRILDIIEELDYQPNVIARSMVTKQSSTIGLIIPDIRNPFFPELVRGVEDSLSKSQYNVFLCNTDGDPDREKKIINLMNEKHVDGIIYANSCSETSKQIKNLLYKCKIPAVFLDRGSHDENFSGVYIDNKKAGYLATKHLIDLSHYTIGCITGPTYLQNSKDRMQGYLTALKDHGIAVKKELIKSGDYQMEGGYQAAKILLTKKKVTAIFTLNDLMAFGVYQAAAELGLTIPDDLSVVGFDNLKYNEILHPKLTTIDQSTYTMGEMAATILFQKIKGADTKENKIIFLEPKLIVRESSKTATSLERINLKKR